ncbi:MAG TPA: hypothetical protein VH040_03140 [Usitatibacter sp.]|nr:hypothetical protein [Usitatibacter sp.]
MSTLKTLLGLGIAIASVQVQAAGIYRCTEPGGAVTYQETACAGVSTGGAANIPTGFPDFNVVEHERILQREAMLDSRLLERYRIDSAERIARDDRIAREKEAAAELAMAEAMSANGGGMPYFVGRVPQSRNRALHRPVHRPQGNPL